MGEGDLAMADGFITTREFDGAMESLREDIHRLDAKFDQLIATKADESRRIGEFCGQIGALLDRVKRAETDSQENRALITGLRSDMEKQDQGRLKWWGQFVLVAVSVGMTWLASRLVK